MADYTSIGEVLAVDGLSDEATFPDATITEAIDWAEELIDRYTGTSWVYKAFSVTLSGNGRRAIRLTDDEGHPVLYPRSITTATESGVSIADFSGWALFPDGLVVRDDASWGSSSVGRNIVVAGTAGFSVSAPEDIGWCARTLARQYAIDLVSRIPDRALQIQNDFGTVQLTQASSHPDRPTSLPDVNARLSRRRQRPDSAAF